MLARKEFRRWQYIPATHLLFINDRLAAHLPDEIIGGFRAEPRLEDAADAEALVLTSEEAPRALQPKPELHKAFLSVLNLFHRGSKFQFP